MTTKTKLYFAPDIRIESIKQLTTKAKQRLYKECIKIEIIAEGQFLDGTSYNTLLRRPDGYYEIHLTTPDGSEHPFQGTIFEWGPCTVENMMDVIPKVLDDVTKLYHSNLLKLYASTKHGFREWL